MSLPLPDDPMTLLAEGASQLHETYSEYIKAGFTCEQAMTLLIHLYDAMLAHAFRGME